MLLNLPFMCANRWWDSWLDYVKQSLSAAANDESFSKRPYAINNSELIKHSDSKDAALGFELRDDLVEGTSQLDLKLESVTCMVS